MITGETPAPVHRRRFGLISIRGLVLAALAALLCGLALTLDDAGQPAHAAVTVYDLAADWSDTSNPNGLWSYNIGDAYIEGSVANWYDDAISPAQPAWAYATSGNPGHIPLWMKSTRDAPGGLDIALGDVVVHTWDDSLSPGTSGPANVTWTSPFDGAISISGNTWIGSDIGRYIRWSLLVNGTEITAGEIGDGDSYSSGAPFDFSGGSGGAGALTGIPVSAFDIVELRMETVTGFGGSPGGLGHFAVVNLTITLDDGTGPADCGSPHPSQVDTDSDGERNPCDQNDDNDDWDDFEDNCPLVVNNDQADADNDGLGDACEAATPPADADGDGDGVLDSVDNCPLTPNTNQLDTDGDGIGDACDTPDVPPSCAAVPPAIVAWWRGEGNTDDFVGGHDGGVLPAGVGYAPGKVGQAFSLSEDASFSVPEDGVRQTSDVFAVDFWVNFSSVPADPQAGDVFFELGWSTGLLRIFPANTHFGRVALLTNVYDPDEDSYRPGQVDFPIERLIDAGQWYHVVIRALALHTPSDADQLMLQMEINGSEVANDQVFIIPVRPPDVIFNPDGPDFRTDGPFTFSAHDAAVLLDEVDLFNYVGAEISQVYNAGSAGKCTGEEDTDGDGIPDATDACPLSPEDMDGFMDGDGCPEAQYPLRLFGDLQEVSSVEVRVNDQIVDSGLAGLVFPANTDNLSLHVTLQDPASFQVSAQCSAIYEFLGGIPMPVGSWQGVPPLEIPPIDVSSGGMPLDHLQCVLTVTSLDPDGDGITGTAEKCPANAEDFDGAYDADGCPEPSVEVRKVLVPADDPGRVALFVNSLADSGSNPNAGNGDTTGRVDILINDPPNFPIIQVGESAAAGSGTDLAKYDVRIDCGNGVTSGTVKEIQGSITATDYVCTITNVRIPDACLGLAPFDNVIIGTDGAESLTGTAGKDLIYGLGGNDTIIGAPGDDCIVGGDGDDVLRGEAVPRRDVDTGTGNDVILGGNGNDTMFGYAGNDTLYGDAGTDVLNGGEGNDNLDGGSGNDALLGGNGFDHLIGGPGILDIANGGASALDTCAAEIELQCELNP